MSFTFFTLGGMQLWTDIFYYRKWHIQRNCFTGKCRLLDNWDIRRADGNFDKCKKAFEKYREIYQLDNPKTHAIIMLHGLGRSKNMFSKMAQRIEAAGFEAIALNFASTRQDIKNQIKQLDFLLSNLDGISQVSFISHGIGGILLRSLLNSDSVWKQKLSLGRIVQINPPNRGNRLTDQIIRYKIGKWLLGPLANQCESAKTAKMPGFPPNTDFAILTAETPWTNKIFDFLPLSWQKHLPKKVDSILPGSAENMAVKINGINSAADSKIITACINFIKNGKFGRL